MKGFLSSVIFLFLLFNYCYSIDAVPDSIIKKLEQTGDKEKIAVLLNVADMLVDSAIYHDQAKLYLDEAYKISTDFNDTVSQIKTLNYLGLNEFTVGNYELASDFYFKSLQLAEQVSDSALIAKVNHNLGMIYDELEEYDEAIDFYRQSLKYDEVHKDTLGILRSFINLSISYQNKKDLTEAQKYCDKAYDLAIQKKDSVLLVAIVNNLGTIAYDKKEYEKGLTYYTEALKLYSDLNDKDGIATTYNNLGLVYLDTKDYPKSKEYFFKALKLAEELNLYDFSGDIYGNLKFYFEETGDYKKALFYYDKFNEVYDSLIGERKNKQIRQLQAKYDLEKKQNQILLLQQETSNQQIIIKNTKAVQVYLILITLVALILVLLMIHLFRNEKKLITELQIKTDKLKDLNISKDKFFSIIAHDLRNPFHALFSYTKLLKNGLDEFSREEISQILSDLHDATDQGYNLLQNLLFWTRSQSNRIHIFRSNFEMKEAIGEVLNLVRPNAAKKDQRIVFDIQNDCMVNADKDMISTILRNLMFNAVKFSDTGKTIRVELSCVFSEVFVKIIDEGVGMDEEQKRKLFVIDEHHSTTGTSGEIGSGLGLILCNEFAAKNEGRINVESESGKGSAFTLILPCVNPDTTSTNE